MIRLLIEITLVLLVLLGIYHLLLAKTSLHKLKRFYLLLCLILPLFVPFIQFEVSEQEQFKIPSDEVVISNLIQTFDQKQPDEIATSIPSVDSTITPLAPRTESFIAPDKSRVNYKAWAIGLYVLITFVLILRYGSSIYKILRKTKDARRERFHDKTVIILKEITPPHNFLDFIFINEKDYENETIRGRLLLHELSHAQQRHSLDILVVELLRIILWFNPMYTILSRAIRNNHEYLADTAVVREIKDISSYQKLLLGFAGQQFTGSKLASPSNYNLIKKRFIMMKHKTPNSVAFLRIALLIPLFLGSTAFFMVKPQANKPIITVATPFLTLPQFENATTPDISPIDPVQHDYGFLSSSSQHTKEQDPAWRVDFFSLPATPVRTTASGIVIEVKKNDSELGNFIRVKHDNTHETLYAHLEEIKVSQNQKLTKGEEIAIIGKKEDIFGKMQYQIIQEGKSSGFLIYDHLWKDEMKPKFNLSFRMTFLKPEIAEKYNLETNIFRKKLPDNLALENMIFDRKKVIIVKHSGETITETAANLNEMQKRAILSIKERPYRLITRKDIPEHIVEKWNDFNYYKIWIDGKRVDNTEMSKYSPDNFAHYSFSSVLKHARNPSAFELYLYTPEYHAKQKATYRAEELEWRKETRKLLKDSGLI